MVGYSDSSFGQADLRDTNGPFTLKPKTFPDGQCLSIQRTLTSEDQSETLLPMCINITFLKFDKFRMALPTHDSRTLLRHLSSRLLSSFIIVGHFICSPE